MSNKINHNFDGKVCLVTGASSGIGLACAQTFLQQGCTVFTAQRSGGDQQFEFIEADFEDSTTPEKVINSVIKTAGKLDILVNNAGIMKEGFAEDTNLETWEQTLKVNLTAPFLLIKHALPYLRKTKGTIVNIGSIEGLGSNPQHSAYCASKAGLHGLTRAIAVDHGNEGIRCNAIAPGWIDTPLNVDFVESMPDPEAFKKEIGGIHPLGRTGKPQEIAELVAWLASDASSFITGQVITADGGRMSQLSLP